MTPRTALVIAILLLVPAVAGPLGCAASRGEEPMRMDAPARPMRPARISHVVLFKLQDPQLTDELIGDCDALLPAIPGVVSYASGTHLETGRDTVDGDYDVALYIGFMTEAGYALYVEHPNHVQLVTEWIPHLEWLRVHDLLDETP